MAMRSVLVAFLVLLSVTELHSQSRGRICIVQSMRSGQPLPDTATLNTIARSVYPGAIDYDTVLPQNLDIFDAIIVQDQYFPLEKIANILPAKSTRAIELLKYLHGGGKFYYENSFFGTAQSDSSAPFWDSIGVTFQHSSAINIQIDSVYGVDSEFTHNFLYKQDSLTTVGFSILDGTLIPILFEGSVMGGLYLPIAWTPADTTMKIVLHKTPIISGYYADFLTRVFCGYFQICTASVDRPGTLSSDLSLQIHSEGERLSFEYNLPANTSAKLCIVNTLGQNVETIPLEQDSQEATMLLSVPSGIYFAQITTRDGAIVKAFPIMR